MENESYRKHVLACCENTDEMRKRSPITYIDTIAKSNLKIFHGKYDNVVPFTHSTTLFNAIMDKYPSASVYLDIFDGGHEIVMQTAVYWLMSQYKLTEKQMITG